MPRIAKSYSLHEAGSCKALNPNRWTEVNVLQAFEVLAEKTKERKSERRT